MNNDLMLVESFIRVCGYKNERYRANVKDLFRVNLTTRCILFNYPDTSINRYNKTCTRYRISTVLVSKYILTLIVARLSAVSTSPSQFPVLCIIRKMYVHIYLSIHHRTLSRCKKKELGEEKNLHRQ